MVGGNNLGYFSALIANARSAVVMLCLVDTTERYYGCSYLVLDTDFGNRR